MKNYILILFSLLLFSCNRNINTLNVTLDNTYGLEKENPIMIKNVTVGKIEEISLNQKFYVNVKIELLENMKIPKDSKFEVSSKDLFTKAIIITPGKSKRYLTDKDKIHCYFLGIIKKLN